MSRFNLVDETWIPVRFPDGKRAEMGIRDALLHAPEIAAIEDPSPLVVAALHRFLLAVLYRALEGPTGPEQAKLLFKNGLPGDKITAYLKKWHDRFWLFDEKYPFFQIASFEPKKWRAWSVLAAEHNADNAKVLFDHVDVTVPGKASPASCARWILAVQTFSVSAGKSELSHTGTAPSATAVMVLPQGRNLSDTLILNLSQQANRAVVRNDKPVWELEPETIGNLKNKPERQATGLANLYTWRSRAVRLKEDQDGFVRQVAFASGIGFKEAVILDPMVGYRKDEKKGKFPIRFRERGLWRDFDSLLPDNEQLSPRVIGHATELSRLDRSRFPHAVLVFGQANDKAKIEFWRMERFALPAALAGDRRVRFEIRQLLDEAKKAGYALEKTVRTAAAWILAKGGRKLEQDKWAKAKWIPGDVSKVIGKTTHEAEPTVLADYWSTLETHFHEILREYTLERDPDDIRCLWLKHVKNALSQSWNRYSASVSSGDSWAIRALVKAEWPVMKKLKELKDEIEKLEPKKEKA